MNFNKSTSILTFIFVLATLPAMAQVKGAIITNKQPFAIGETVYFTSEILHENRALNIYLPLGYEENIEKNYPVIYLLDGSSNEDFIHISGLVQFASFSWINIMPETIVVGIANVDRKRDFTYPSNSVRDKLEYPMAGESNAFIQFIENEVQPLINTTYRVTSEKTLIGQSLGGLLATEILFKHPALFNNYIIVSPSLWWDDESLLAYSPKKRTTPTSIYLAVGKEGPTMEQLAYKLKNKLEASKDGSSKIYFNFLQAQNHGDALHLAAYDAFEKIFKQATKK